MNILITGSSGFIGSNLYKDFKKIKKIKFFLIDKKMFILKQKTLFKLI